MTFKVALQNPNPTLSLQVIWPTDCPYEAVRRQHNIDLATTAQNQASVPGSHLLGAFSFDSISPQVIHGLAAVNARVVTISPIVQVVKHQKLPHATKHNGVWPITTTTGQ
ncbi:MAG: hypothetical protein KIT63_02505 [Rhodoferax sp.]|nr:hypothetical protein [Rhodoferax sp.]